MKVSNSKDTVDLQSAGRSSRAKRAEAANDAKNASAREVSSSKVDSAKVEISNDSKILAKGIEAAKGAEVSDKEKIAAIKQRIKDGTYNPDMGEVADRMLNEQILNS